MRSVAWDGGFDYLESDIYYIHVYYVHVRTRKSSTGNRYLLAISDEFIFRVFPESGYSFR